jgi:urea carboxylase-associated protein 2
MSETPATSTTTGARDHARSMAGTVVAAMPTMPPNAATDLPAGVDPGDVLWDEVVAGGGYTAMRLPRGAHLRVVDRQGDACAGLLLHRTDRPSERLSVADTVKVQWQAYLREGQLLLSDMGRVLAAVVEDTSGRHDTFCGTTNRGANDARYVDGAPHGPSPNGRDHFAVAMAKLGLDRRDIAPNINLFAGVRVDDDGTLSLDERPGPAGAAVTLRLELGCLVSIVNVPHPLDHRPVYTVTPLRVLAWAGTPAAPDDPFRIATPEAERAYLNTESEALR